MCDDMCLGCSECETPEAPPTLGDKYLGVWDMVWTVIGTDRSGQGIVLQGQDRQVRTEPVNETGHFTTRHLKRI